MNESISLFIAQFPDSDITEESVALYSEEEGEYVGINFHFGCCIEKAYSKERKKGKHTRVICKKYLGSVYCNNTECTFYEIDHRPYALKNDIEKQQCLICDSKLERRLCTVRHLTVAEKCHLDEKVDEDPHVKLSKAIVGVSSRTGEAVRSIYSSVSMILINKGRAKYELNNAKQRMGVSSRTGFLGEFEKIESEYEGFISSAEVANQAFCIIFCSPEIKKFELPFSSQFIVTDVTYKAVKDNYCLCSSVIYVPHLKKHLVILQAIIGSLEWIFFKKYFKAFFQYFGISRKFFLGVVMDFSIAQRRGFWKPIDAHFRIAVMQSVQRIASNYAVVPQGFQAESTKLLPEVANADDEKDDFEFGIHNFLKQLIEEHLSVESRLQYDRYECRRQAEEIHQEILQGPSNERKQKQKITLSPDEAVNKERDEDSDSEMTIDLTEKMPGQYAANIHRYDKTLRPNTANSCYIDAIFELLWHSVMPHFEEAMLSNFDPHKKIDSILKTSYKWHRLNTDDGLNRTSYSMRKFVWENKISNRDEGFWGDCNEVLETFLNSMSPSARSFCDIGRFMHINSVQKIKIISGEDSAELPGITTRHNMIETEKPPLFLFVSDLTNIAPALRKTPQYFPCIAEIAETKYILQGKVYSAELLGVHFYTVSKIAFSGTIF
ncbi:hypothetical protein G6F68_002569 [Rhizopus microsporus]|nr:hypothetical protein G6F68_002569 [Rhizopus microsporus]